MSHNFKINPPLSMWPTCCAHTNAYPHVSIIMYVKNIVSTKGKLQSTIVFTTSF